MYDDEEKWKAEDLSLLSVGARVVPISQRGKLLRRIAMQARISISALSKPARELGCDEDKERFEEKLKRIVKAKSLQGNGMRR